MRSKTQSISASIIAVFIVTVVIPSYASASSLIHDPDDEAVIQHNSGILGRAVTETEDLALSSYRLSSELLLHSVASSPSYSSGQPKSPGKAFFFSGAIPGVGEFYSKAKRGVFFVAAEVVLWTAYAMLHGRGEELKEDYIGFCKEHIMFEEDSPATSTDEWTLEDYEHATQGDNWRNQDYTYDRVVDGEKQPLERVGKFYWDDLPEDMIVTDPPGGVPIEESQSRSRVQAYDKRMSTNDRFKQAKTLIGLVVINHIISAIDARIVAKIYNNRNSKTEPEISFHPTISPSGYPGAYLTIHGRF